MAVRAPPVLLLAEQAQEDALVGLILLRRDRDLLVGKPRHDKLGRLPARDRGVGPSGRPRLPGVRPASSRARRAAYPASTAAYRDQPVFSMINSIVPWKMAHIVASSVLITLPGRHEIGSGIHGIPDFSPQPGSHKNMMHDGSLMPVCVLSLTQACSNTLLE